MTFAMRRMRLSSPCGGCDLGEGAEGGEIAQMVIGVVAGFVIGMSPRFLVSQGVNC